MNEEACEEKSAEVDTPLGRLYLKADENGLREAKFAEKKLNVVVVPPHPAAAPTPISSDSSDSSDSSGNSEHPADQSASGVLKAAVHAVNRYFAGDCAALRELPLSMEGSAFQLKVWNELRNIPEGSTETYGEVAAAVGLPTGARAVGTACRTNPIVLFVPCHRVLGKNNALTGYAADLQRKQLLLRHEGAR